jgi:hypothetical protein
MTANILGDILSDVIRGLDPRIHDGGQYVLTYRFSLLRFTVDCRVKPGNDSGETP